MYVWHIDHISWPEFQGYISGWPFNIRYSKNLQETDYPYGLNQENIMIVKEQNCPFLT